MSRGRPAVDIVIPFGGPDEDLRALLARLDRIAVRDGDRVIVADNRADSDGALRSANPAISIICAPDVRSSYHARNRAVAAGHAEWIVFLDADVEWTADAIDAYFDPPPGERTGVLAGGIVDQSLDDPSAATLAERYAVSMSTMASSTTLEPRDRLPYAQTANCAVRRAAFEAVGAFSDEIRSGGDADLSFRLQAASWEIEGRPSASVIHRNRRSLVALMAQKARHGAGAAWLDRRYPGSFPRRRWSGLALWSVRALARGARNRWRLRLVEVTAVWAFELGRLLPNRASGVSRLRPRGRRPRGRPSG